MGYEEYGNNDSNYKTNPYMETKELYMNSEEEADPIKEDPFDADENQVQSSASRRTPGNVLDKKLPFEIGFNVPTYLMALILTIIVGLLSSVLFSGSEKNQEKPEPVVAAEESAVDPAPAVIEPIPSNPPAEPVAEQTENPGSDISESQDIPDLKEKIPDGNVYGIITASDVRVRSDAGTESTLVGTASTGDSLPVLSWKVDPTGKTWYEVQLNNGNSGYIRSDFLYLEEKAE
ncbi:MAG: SH3 domain-containing protein [Lachnospiraceae bacterium]|nr:SH3 domain-containing protein [Lachnospiraceae bacterium]